MTKQKIINNIEKIMIDSIDHTSSYAKAQIKEICKELKSDRTVKFNNSMLELNLYNEQMIKLDEIIVALMDLGCNAEISSLLDIVKYKE